jgi:hypothetical protein
MLEDRLGNLGFAVFQGDTPYLISPYAGEIAEINDRERQGATSDRSPITHRSLRCPPLDTKRHRSVRRAEPQHSSAKTHRKDDSASRSALAPNVVTGVGSRPRFGFIAGAPGTVATGNTGQTSGSSQIRDEGGEARYLWPKR